MYKGQRRLFRKQDKNWKKPFIIFPFKKGFIEKILNFLMKF